MITQSTMLTDDFEDDILTVLKLMKVVGGKKWQGLSVELINLLKAKGYVSFFSDHAHYKISKVGYSYLYDVPLYKRGHLSGFKGKRVRIVCTRSGSNFTRGYMAGVVGNSPPDKIVSKLTYKYTFPSYVNSHEVIYKSPRFMVIKNNKAIEMLSKKEPKGFIDKNGWDSILVDGKIGLPIATINHNSDGTVSGKILGWSLASVYPSLREAIDELKK